MGLFSKKNKENNEESKMFNELLSTALEFNQETGTWTILPGHIPDETQEKVIAVRKIMFEYIKQLKEAKVYSNMAVQRFAKQEFKWVNKENINKVIKLGQFL